MSDHVQSRSAAMRSIRSNEAVHRTSALAAVYVGDQLGRIADILEEQFALEEGEPNWTLRDIINQLGRDARGR